MKKVKVAKAQLDLSQLINDIIAAIVAVILSFLCTELPPILVQLLQLDCPD